MGSGLISQFCCRLPARRWASCLLSAQCPPAIQKHQHLLPASAPFRYLFLWSRLLTLNCLSNMYQPKVIPRMSPRWFLICRVLLGLLPCVVLSAVLLLSCQNTALWCLGPFNLLQCKKRGKGCLWITCCCWSRGGLQGCLFQQENKLFHWGTAWKTGCSAVC